MAKTRLQRNILQAEFSIPTTYSLRHLNKPWNKKEVVAPENFSNKLLENSGLAGYDLSRIAAVFARNPHVEAVLLFGSRAMGTHHAGSDVDLAMKGKLLDPGMLSQFRQELEALHLPFFFDVLHYDALKDPEVKEHVDRVGVRLE